MKVATDKCTACTVSGWYNLNCPECQALLVFSAYPDKQQGRKMIQSIRMYMKANGKLFTDQTIKQRVGQLIEQNKVHPI